MFNKVDHKHLIKESDLFEISRYLEGDKDTKLGSKKGAKKLENVGQKKQIDVYVNKIWDYLKDKDTDKLIDYIENRAETVKEMQSDRNMDEIYSEIVNDQKRGNLFTPLHFAIKFKNLKAIKALVFTYNADITIENKDGHDPVEYLHLGEVSTSKSTFSTFRI